MVFFSTTLTPTSTKQQLLSNKPATNVLQLQINVRSMGDATYIAVGGTDTQDRRLVTIGENISLSAVYPRRFIDASSIYVISDGTTPVLEIFGEAEGASAGAGVIHRGQSGAPGPGPSPSTP